MLRSVLLALLLPTVALAADPVAQGPKNVPEFEPAFANQTRAPAMTSGFGVEAAWFVRGLERPWGMATLPDGRFLVTERVGRLRMLSPDGMDLGEISDLPEVFVKGQGGMLDVMVGPDFADDGLVYGTYAKPMGGGTSVTAAFMATLDAETRKLNDVQDIFVQDPPSPTAAHYGSRILFGVDGDLYITTGEHSSRDERVLAQDLSTTYGKVIRLNGDGSVPTDNPYDSQVWTYGHRNMQGAAVRPGDGALFTIEHGPKGGDELNLIQPGANYGWPVVSYGENYNGRPVGTGEHSAEGMAEPVYYWDPVIAPGGMAFYDGDMFPEWRGDLIIASLNPGGVVRLRLDGDRVVGEERFLRGARIRDIEIAPDGAILALVDAADGGVLRLTPDR